MERLPLPEYVAQLSQAKVAAKLGVCQSAIHKALSTKRNITVLLHDDGKVEAEEVRPFPSSKDKIDYP